MKRIISLSLLAMSFLTVSTSFAKDNDKAKASKSTSTNSTLVANVAYLGSEESNPVFNLDIDNPSNQKVMLRILDDNGEILYSHTYSEVAHLNKKIMLNINPAYLNSNRKVTFQIQSKGQATPVRKTYNLSETEVYKNIIDVKAS